MAFELSGTLKTTSAPGAGCSRARRGRARGGAVHRLAEYAAVGAGEVDELEDAAASRRGG